MSFENMTQASTLASTRWSLKYNPWNEKSEQSNANSVLSKEKQMEE